MRSYYVQCASQQATIVAKGRRAAALELMKIVPDEANLSPVTGVSEYPLTPGNEDISFFRTELLLDQVAVIAKGKKTFREYCPNMRLVEPDDQIRMALCQ